MAEALDGEEVRREVAGNPRLAQADSPYVSIKAPSGKVVSFQGFVDAKAAAYDTRVAANAAVPKGESIRPRDAEIRAARATGRIEARPLTNQSATVLDMAYGACAARVGALLAEGKDIEALGVVLLHAVETTNLPVQAPLVDDSHTFRMP